MKIAHLPRSIADRDWFWSIDLFLLIENNRSINAQNRERSIDQRPKLRSRSRLKRHWSIRSAVAAPSMSRLYNFFHCTKKPYQTACRKLWMLNVSQQLVTKVWNVHSFNHFSSFKVWPQTKRVKTTKGYRSLEAMPVACLMVARGMLAQKWINFSPYLSESSHTPFAH